jgi:hypothetical protein
MTEPQRRRVLLASAAAALLFSWLDDARAQSPVEEYGSVHASLRLPMPSDRPVAVRPLDDVQRNQALARRLADALRAAGWRVQSAGNALQLNFETELQHTPVPARRDPSDTRDLRGRVRFVLVLTADDPASGRRLWEGTAAYLGHPNDEARIFAQLAHVIAGEVGKTAPPRGFTLE